MKRNKHKKFLLNQIIINHKTTKKVMKKFFLIALVALTTTIGCKKENDDKEPNPQPTPPASKLVKKFIETEGGQTTTHNVTYDAAKRPIAITSTDNSEVLTFTYDGNGNITKVESKED